MSKRIVSFFLCFVMAFSLVVVPSSADYIGTPVTFFDRLLHWGVNGADDVSPVLGALGQFSGFIYGTVCTGSDDGYHHANSISGCEIGTDKDGQYAVAMCRYCGESFKVYGADLESAYNTYVTDLQTDLGTTMLIDGGVRYYPTVTALEIGEYLIFTEQNFGNPFSATLSLTNSDYDHKKSSIKLVWHEFEAPFAGSYRWYHEYSKTSTGSGQVDQFVYWPSPSSGSCLAGDVFSPSTSYFLWCYPYYFANGDWYGITGALWIDFYPAPGASLPTEQDITINSRPSSIIGDYGIIGDNGTIIKVDGNVIVDESCSTVYNPVTNTTLNYTDYAYDYSDRSYNLTLEDGSTMKVTYGDENVTINEGDTVYNIYYIVPEADQEDDGSGSGDTGDIDSSAGWAWLKGAWTQMIDKLSGILEAITDLELSPEINVDVEVGGEEQVTQESWFSDLLAKFGFLTSIHDIYTQLVADVSSDAATAAAVADGAVMLADVTSGHAAIDGRASYTAPELAISFGSSDKYGVDWAGIRPLNLSWYAPHKETVDGILSGILWLSYLFLLIKRAPGIIRGAEMVTEDRIKIDSWRMLH